MTMSQCPQLTIDHILITYKYVNKTDIVFVRVIDTYYSYHGLCVFNSTKMLIWQLSLGGGLWSPNALRHRRLDYYQWS